VSNKHPILDGVRSTEVTAATVSAPLLYTHNRRSEARKQGACKSLLGPLDRDPTREACVLPQ
jgi:hypothetical protein